MKIKIQIFLVLLPIIFIVIIIANYMLNIPYWDDYLVEQHLSIQNSQPNLFNKLILLFDQHWEHRIVFTRILFYIDQKIFGRLNYPFLSYVAHAGLVIILFIFGKQLSFTKSRVFQLIPVSFAIFTLKSFENTIWGMASIQNYWVLTFAVLAFNFIVSKNKYGFLYSLMFCLFAGFTSGNGLLVFICVSFYLVSQKDWKKLVYWTIVFCMFLYFYFHNYSRIRFFPSAFLYPYIDWIQGFLYLQELIGCLILIHILVISMPQFFLQLFLAFFL